LCEEQRDYVDSCEGAMISNNVSSDALQEVLLCQQQFWQALQEKDAALFAQVLADGFVCRSPGQPDQQRTPFIATITGMPITVMHVTAEQVTIDLFDNIAILMGTQVAYLRLPNGNEVLERLALTNIFRYAAHQWQMVLAHPVPLPSQSDD
jgi:ketosteroid isomerase-like protein